MGLSTDKACFAERENLRLLRSRGDALLSALDEVLHRRTWNRAELEANRFRALADLVGRAYSSSPFYRAKYDAAGFHPSMLGGPGDLARIPFLTKDELRKADPLSLAIGSASDSRSLFSSGSTGVPLRIRRDESALWYFTAQNTAAYFDWCDGQPISNVLYFTDMTSDSIDGALADLLRTTVMESRLVSVNESLPVLRDCLLEFRPEFLSSYPSTLRNLAMDMVRRGESHRDLRLIHATSEMLDERTRALLARAFPAARIVETYTSSEAGLLGWQCAPGGPMHLAEDSAIFEIVDRDGRPTDDTGELVVTDLVNRAAPLLRYRGLGDFCRWERGTCSCGSVCRTIGRLQGRSSDSIALPDGRRISPYELINVLEKLPDLCQFQIVQHGASEIELLIVAESAVDADAVAAAAQQAVFPILGAGTVVTARPVASIPPVTGGHKTPLVVSRTGGAT